MYYSNELGIHCTESRDMKCWTESSVLEFPAALKTFGVITVELLRWLSQLQYYALQELLRVHPMPNEWNSHWKGSGHRPSTPPES